MSTFLQENEHEISMSQSKYIRDISDSFHMTNSKLSNEMSPKIQSEMEEVQNLPYLNLIKIFLNLAVSTRPDIAHAVSVFSQYNFNFGLKCKLSAKRVSVCYLKGTEHLGLIFRRTGNMCPSIKQNMCSNPNQRMKPFIFEIL